MQTIIETITEAILAEIQGVMGLRKVAWVRHPLGGIFRPAARRLAGMMVHLSEDISQLGWSAAFGEFIKHFIESYRVEGAEEVPKEGPLLVASNHPAAYDLLILSASLGRDDLKIISSTIPAISILPAIQSHFIFMSGDPYFSLAAVRAGLRHLLKGGALLTFARGDAEPDPALSPGAEQSLTLWSPSLDLFLRQAPQTRAVVSIISGVLSPRWFHSPLLRLWKKPEQRQKVAEVFQVTEQILWARRLPLEPLATLSPPLTIADLETAHGPQGNLLDGIFQQARELLARHLKPETG